MLGGKPLQPTDEQVQYTCCSVLPQNGLVNVRLGKKHAAKVVVLIKKNALFLK
jgi:hypothetical protein